MQSAGFREKVAECRVQRIGAGDRGRKPEGRGQRAEGRGQRAEAEASLVCKKSSRTARVT